MTSQSSGTTTRNSKVIKASPEMLYRAFTDPAALAVWLAPGEMTGKVHSFDGAVGGGYQISLFYPPSEKASRGKTSEKEDRYTARFVELTPPRRIVPAEATITLKIAVTDELTGEPVAGTIQVGDQVIVPMSEATIRVPANADQIVTVTAPGNEIWKVGIRPHVTSDKVLTMPVRLKPKQGDV